jgi:uncharacterized protein YyaL (SSP411 family)
MQAIAPLALRHPAFGGYALAVWLTHLIGMEEVAIVGNKPDELVETVWSRFRPNVALAVGRGEQASVPLLEGRPSTGIATAYVCRGFVCDLPVSSPEGLRHRLDATLT